MPGITSALAPPPQYRRNSPPRPRSEAKRARIIDASMKHFAEHGYHAARVGDIAAQLSIAKGSIFQHFGSKDGLFFEVYIKAVRSFPGVSGLSGGSEARGFWEILRYWSAAHREHAARQLGALPDLSDRKLRHRSRPAAGDQPISGDRRSLWVGSVCALRA